MAITRALMNRQMYNMGGPALEAGAPDLRLTGDQRNRGSYTQRRRAQMAGGGIMGSNAGSMLVAPTADGSRPGYGWLSDIKDKFVDDIIPNEIKENPMLTAALVGGGLNQFGLPDFLVPESMHDTGKNWLGDLLGGYDTVIGGPGEQGKPLSDIWTNIFPGAKQAKLSICPPVSSYSSAAISQIKFSTPR